MTKKGVMILAFSLSMLLSGCTTNKPEITEPEPPIVGGVTDNSDFAAPKTIESTEIESFYADFFAYDPYDSSRDGNCTYKIERNTEGAFILEAKSFYEHETEVTAEDLMGLQAIIEKYELVKNNGTDKVTAGLAPECGPATLEVIYASGEKLYFCEDGDPWAGWSQEVKKYVEDILIREGFEDEFQGRTDE